MTRLSAALRAVLLIAFFGAVASCGRSDIGLETGGGGGPPGNGCTTDADCTTTPGKPHCELPQGECVACTKNSDCPTGDVCSNNHCVGFCGSGGTCTGGFACCSPLCVDEKTDPSNCGACGNVCGPFAHASADCGGSTCSIDKCDPGFSDCDKVASNGCEISTGADPKNCGGCGK